MLFIFFLSFCFIVFFIHIVDSCFLANLISPQSAQDISFPCLIAYYNPIYSIFSSNKTFLHIGRLSEKFEHLEYRYIPNGTASRLINL